MKVFGAGLLFLCTLFPAYASDPDFARHLNRIEQLLANDQFTEASQLAKALVADNEEQEALHQRLLGYIYLHEGNADRAAMAYTKALEYKKLPDNLRKDVLGALVSLSMTRGRPEIAVLYGEMYVSEYPPFQPVEQLYARALFSGKDYQKALEHANAIIARYADAPEYIWQIKLLSEEQLNQNRALINTIRLVQLKYGNDIRWERKKAGAYSRLGDFGKAADTLAQQLDGGAELNGQDYVDLAQFAAMAGKPYQAIDWLDKGLEAGAIVADREFDQRKLQLYIQAAEWTKAWNIASKLNQQPELPLLRAQCRIASQLQRWPEAATLAQQAIDLGGEEDTFLWQILGYSAMKTNDKVTARYAYETLKTLDPDSDAEVWLKTLDLMETK